MKMHKPTLPVLAPSS